MMLKVDQIKFKDSGKKITYKYSYDKSISKYFNLKEPFFVSYDIDVSKTPESIAIIPFLANIIPVSWFAGFTVIINELDIDFADCLEKIKSEFVRDYPTIDFNQSELIINNLVYNESYIKNRTAMLFSGGVDAYATYFRHYDENPDLITIHGADIDVKDEEQWKRLVLSNNQEPLLKNNLKFYIKTNLRSFYTHNVDLLLPELGWWGKVQHGLALNAVIAPLSFIREYEKNYIASSYTKNIDILWGSTPDIDNNIKWGGTEIIHDGYELKRQDKIDLIVKSYSLYNTNLNLRVCYSLLNSSINCSKCEKCYRTIIGIILNNENPNNFGFKVDESIYDTIIKMFSLGFSSEGVQYFWSEILEKMKIINDFYEFSDNEEDSQKLNNLKKLIEANLKSGLQKKSKMFKLKYKIQNLFPNLFKLYLKIRQRNL